MLCQKREIRCKVGEENKYISLDGKRRKHLQGTLWVRTRESRGGLSERGKGSLLHSQLVELGQLLKG